MEGESRFVAIGVIALVIVGLFVALATGGCAEGGKTVSVPGSSLSTVVAASAGDNTGTRSTKAPEQLLADSIESEFKANFSTGPFVLTQVALTPGAKGGQQFFAQLNVPSVEEANPIIRDVMMWFRVKISALNRDSRSNIGLLHVFMQTPGGQMVVDWTEDLAAGTATGDWANGINNYWFPSPAPTSSSAPYSHIRGGIDPSLGGLLNQIQALGYTHGVVVTQDKELGIEVETQAGQPYEAYEAIAQKVASLVANYKEDLVIDLLHVRVANYASLLAHCYRAARYSRLPIAR